MQPQYPDQFDLDTFGAQAAPQRMVTPGLESIPDGDHDFEVIAATLGKAAGHTVARCELRVLTANGRTIEYTWWLNRQESVNAFLADMVSLGYPAQGWGSGPAKTPLSQAIPQAMTKLQGVRFRATKATRHVPAKPAANGMPAKEAATYRDLHISGRIAGTPMPSAPAAPQQHLPPQGGAPTQLAHQPLGQDSEIPFAFLPFLLGALTLGGLLA